MQSVRATSSRFPCLFFLSVVSPRLVFVAFYLFFKTDLKVCGKLSSFIYLPCSELLRVTWRSMLSGTLHWDVRGFLAYCYGVKLLPKLIRRKAEACCPPWRSPLSASLLLSSVSSYKNNHFCCIHTAISWQYLNLRQFPFSPQGICHWSINNTF